MLQYQGMKLRSIRRRAGFTLIELIVVVVILVAMGAIAVPVLFSARGTSDVTACKEQMGQLAVLAKSYSDELVHRSMLPTSGMADDEDTEEVNETDGWWVALAQEDTNNFVYPKEPGGNMKISSIFHCPADGRAKVDGDRMEATCDSVSYVSWTDASQDPENPNSCIRTAGRRDLAKMPWLSDGFPESGKSVTDYDSFLKMVWPAADRHANTIVVLYADMSVKGIEVDPDATDTAEVYRKIAPAMPDAADAGKKAKKGKNKGKKKDSK